MHLRKKGGKGQLQGGMGQLAQLAMADWLQPNWPQGTTGRSRLAAARRDKEKNLFLSVCLCLCLSLSQKIFRYSKSIRRRDKEKNLFLFVCLSVSLSQKIFEYSKCQLTSNKETMLSYKNGCKLFSSSFFGKARITYLGNIDFKFRV